MPTRVRIPLHPQVGEPSRGLLEAGVSKRKLDVNANKYVGSSPAKAQRLSCWLNGRAPDG